MRLSATSTYPLDRPALPVDSTDCLYRHLPGADLHASLYRPAVPGRFPGLVCVHGGAWCAGDRHLLHDMAVSLAACGLVVMAIDFRMGPAYKFPVSLYDIDYAVRWLRSHADAYSVNAECIGGFGVSSGGHLILMHALHALISPCRDDDETDLSEIDASLDFVFTASGVLDPLARYQMAQAQSLDEIIACHEIYFAGESSMAEARPSSLLHLWHAQSPSLPPALFFQGGADARLPPDTAECTAQTYRAAGGRAEALIYPHEGHALRDWSSVARADVLLRSAALIRALPMLSA